MAIVRKLVLGVAGVALAGAGGFFALGQVSQRGAAQGLVNGTLAPCPDSPNCVSSEAATVAEKKVAVLSPDSWGLLPDAIVEMGGVVTQSGEDYISAEFTSSTFGFVDDLELRRTDDAVHVRSASRVGYSDAGVNAERVEALRDKMSELTLGPGHVS